MPPTVTTERLHRFDCPERRTWRNRGIYLLKSPHSTSVPFAISSNCDILSAYRERACSQRSSNRAKEKATVLTFERRDTAVGAKPTLAFSQIPLSRASLHQEVGCLHITIRL